MNKLIRSDILSTGFAMFSMFFGAGNIIFPLVVGQYAGSNNLLAIFGLIITAVLMPFAGVFAMILFDGNYQNFFKRIGRIPGFLVALTILTLLGPVGSIPRCIALSYSTMKTSFPELSIIGFSAFTCVLIYLLTCKKSQLINLLGKILTPVLLLSLFGIIIKGLLTASEYPIESSGGHVNFFMYGLKEGYNTMDLMAAFFFSSTIISILKSKDHRQNGSSSKNYLKLTVQASFVGAILLAAVYVGFSYVAAFHAHTLPVQASDELLSALTIQIAGPYAGYLACTTIALACLTTAIALSSVFTDFIQKEVFHNKISFEKVLAGSLIITFFVSTFEFSGISAFLGPILEICYPGLIALTFFNIIFHKRSVESLTTSPNQ